MVYGLEFIKRRNKFYSYNMYAALIFFIRVWVSFAVKIISCLNFPLVLTWYTLFYFMVKD